MFALNEGEVCTCPSRILIQESIYEKFIEKAVARVERIKAGHPLDLQTMIGAQASQQQLDKILSYIDIGRGEGAQCLTGGERTAPAADLGTGYYVKPTMLLGNNKMRVFREEIFGPVASVMTFRTSRRRSNSRTTRSTGSARACGRATARGRTGWAARSRPAACGPTATTCIPRMRRSVATSSRGSAARRTRWRCRTISRRSACW